MKKLFQTEFIKIINYGPVKILIPLHMAFFFLGFFALPNILPDLPFLTIQPLYQFPHAWNLFSWLGGYYNITLVLLVIMLTSIEFTNHTYKHQVIFGLSRADLFKQKLILAFIITLYAIVIFIIAVLISGFIYSYKITSGIILERSWIILSYFLQLYTWLMLGILFALIFKNMILSVLTFGFYRVILEPIIRNFQDKDIRAYFPTKFVSKLTPEPDIFRDTVAKLKSMDASGPGNSNVADNTLFGGIPFWQNIVLSIIFLGIILFFTLWLFRRRRLN